MIKFISKIFAIPFCLLVLLGFGEAKNSKVEVVLTPDKDKAFELEFKVIPFKGKGIAVEGPWGLSLTKTEGLDVQATNGKVQFKTFDAKIPGFRIKLKAKAAGAKGDLSYELKSFICEENKTRCYVEIHKGTVNWVAP